MKKTIFILFFIYCMPYAFAQENARELDPVINHLNEQLISFPHEKIYVQTDKSTYISGERIWSRIHLLDAASGHPAFLSRYIYLELFTPFEELVKRVKIRPDSLGVYSGYIDLEEDLAEGDYTLRAYTRYARNRGNEAFFKKKISVFDPYSLQIEPIANFKIENNRVDVNFRFVNRINTDTVAPEIVTVKLSDETTRTLAPKGETNYSWSFSLTRRRNNRNLLLGIVHEGRIYNRYFAIPYAPEDVDITFHPEGGYLIPGHTCRVGFKAINSAGLGERVTGAVYNSNDEEVAVFTSYKLGMGSFHLSVEPDETYYAVCETKNGTVKRIDLPAAEPRARTVSMRRGSDRVLVTLLKGADAPDDAVSLLIHNKGFPLYHKPWSPETDSYAFPEEAFPSGITGFLLLNKNLEILSERLIFNHNEKDFAEVKTELSASVYQPRERIALTVELEGVDTVSAYDNFSLSVTDKNRVVHDTTNNLISTLLLSSELQGYIESPARYFTGHPTDRLALDALMTTQGWRRYDIPRVLKGEIRTPDNFQPELFQEIKGRTEALLRSMEEGEITLIATLDTLLSTETTLADNKGRFMFMVEYPEGTQITVQSISKKGSSRNLIHLEEETFPSSSFATLPFRGEADYPANYDIDEYLKKANDEYSLKHGIRTIMLEEVLVTASRQEQYTKSKFYSPISSTGLISAEDIEKRKVSSLRSLLISSPGIIVKSDRVTTTRSDSPVLFVIDDMVYEDFFDQLDAIDVNSIDNLFVMKDNTFMLGYYPNTSGAVVITTKSGFEQKNSMSPNIDRIQPLGYQQAAEFYSPKYETPEEVASSEPDFRTTIYWKPNVHFSRTGKTVVEFYSADTPTTYQVIGEGVTGEGKIIYFTKDIPVESNNK